MPSRSRSDTGNRTIGEEEELEKRICVVGSGAAGLITAHTLVRDGFRNVDVLSRDRSPGGVWAKERVYPGLSINNVHGEFRFSSLPMPPPAAPQSSTVTAAGCRLSGEDMRAYMERFEARFLEGKIRYGVRVLKVRRVGSILGQGSDGGGDTVAGARTGGSQWIVSVQDKDTPGQHGYEELRYDRIVLCSGGCHTAYAPSLLSSEAARAKGFVGLVIHSSEVGQNVDALLSSVSPLSDLKPGTAVIVGGGKSAQDAAAFLARRGRRVIMVFDKADAFLAAPIPLPGFIRKSRFLSVLSPHVELRTRLERFLHTTWLGSKFVRGFWDFLAWSAFFALSIPKSSPLRNTHSLFWGLRTNDEGAGHPQGFHALANAGKIEIISPARAQCFGDDGRSLVLDDRRAIECDAVVLATGFQSSWAQIFDAETMEELGLNRHSPSVSSVGNIGKWDYISLDRPEGVTTSRTQTQQAASIHRGIVPAANIMNRDFAINGALFSTNNGYTFEVIAHWISSYFRRDPFLRLPPSAEAAVDLAEEHNTWLRRRYPGMFGWVNESYSGDFAFWNWPQAVDTLLEDMGLKSMRSGGNWFTWPFRVIDSKEIQFLTEERETRRKQCTAKNG